MVMETIGSASALFWSGSPTQEWWQPLTQSYGFLVKPECRIPENFNFPQDIIEMMDEQRKIQASKPKDERVYVGAEIQIHGLSEQGLGIYTLHRFEDYDRDETAMYDDFHLSQISQP